jgi:hypothetical protein
MFVIVFVVPGYWVVSIVSKIGCTLAFKGCFFIDEKIPPEGFVDGFR